MAICKFCKGTMEWSEGGDGKWVAYDLDGQRHKCSAYAKKTPAPRSYSEPIQSSIGSEELLKAINMLAAEIRELRKIIQGSQALSDLRELAKQQ